MTEKFSEYSFSNEKVEYIEDRDECVFNSGFGYINKSDMIDKSIYEGDIAILKFSDGYIPIHSSQINQIFKDYELTDGSYNLKEICQLVLTGLAKEFNIGPYLLSDIGDIQLFANSILVMSQRFFMRQN